MFKRVLFVLLAILMLTTVGCKKKAEKPATEAETAATQEQTVPGMEDSIFDDPAQSGETVAAPVEVIPEATRATLAELPAPGEMDFETFQNLEPSQQRAYQESFESIDAFYEWYSAAQEAYEQAHPAIEVGDGVIDMNEIVGN